MTIPLAHPAPPATSGPRATTALGYASRPSPPAANEARVTLRTPRDERVVRGAAAAASLLAAVAWLDAIARIAALYG